MLDNTNVLDILVTGYLIENTEMVKICTEFVIKHRGKVMKYDDKWQLVKKQHPKLINSIVDILLTSAET
jgi:hypothetical protein